MAGILIYRGIYYYTLSASRIIPLIASMGLFILLMDLYRLLAGPYKKQFPAMVNLPNINTQWFYITGEQLLIIGLTALFLLLVYVIANRTKLGLGWQACAQDMDMARAVGVNINKVVALNFFIGSALAGAAGVLMALYHNSVYPTMGGVVSYKAFVVVVLGGLGNIGGSIVAALVLSFVETFLTAWEALSFPRDAIAFLVLVLILMFRPQGLFKRV
jgi:branched-chain amino acid transport system permease protein